MKSPFCVIVAILSSIQASAWRAVLRSSDHPVERVISLLKTMIQDNDKNTKTEVANFQKYKYFCKNMKQRIAKAAKENEERRGEIILEIEGLTETKKSLEIQLSKNGEETEKATTAMGADEKQCEENKEDTIGEKNEIENAIQALTDALEGVQNSKPSAALIWKMQALSKLEFFQESVTDGEQEMVDSLFALPNATARNRVYDFKSDNVIELLKGLLVKFQAKLDQKNKEFDAIGNACELSKDSYTKNLEALASKKEQLGNGLDGTNGVKASLAQANSDFEKVPTKEEEEVLGSECYPEQEQQWIERQEARKEERDALAKALQVLSEFRETNTKVPDNKFIKPEIPDAEQPPSFLQLGDPQDRAVQLLHERAHLIQSKTLERLAGIIDEYEHDKSMKSFGRIMETVNTFIRRLGVDLGNEKNRVNKLAKDLSLKEGEQEDLSTKVSMTKASLEQLSAEQSELRDGIADAEKDLGNTVETLQEAAANRKDASKENAVAIEDAQKTIAALDEAVAIIQEVLSGGVVMEVKESPELAQVASGQAGSASAHRTAQTVLDLLEKANSDMSKLVADTRTQETEDQSKFDNFKSKCDILIAKLKQTIKDKGDESSRVGQKTADAQGRLKRLETSLEAVTKAVEILQTAKDKVDRESTIENIEQMIQALKDAAALIKEGMEKASSKVPAAAVARGAGDDEEKSSVGGPAGEPGCDMDHCGPSKSDWDEKCTWYVKCSACNECSGRKNLCGKWCATNTAPWEEKCSWNRLCGGCPDCKK